MAKATNSKLMKAFVAGMMIACVAAGGCAAYFYAFAEPPASEMATQQQALLIALKDTKSRSESLNRYNKSRSESLSRYNELKGNRAGNASSEVKDKDMDEVLDELTKLVSETYNIKADKYKIQNASPAADSRRDFERHAIHIKLLGESRRRYQDILLDIHNNYGSFASVETLKVMPGKRKPDLNKSVDESSLEWDVDISLVWYTQNNTK